MPNFKTQTDDLSTQPKASQRNAQMRSGEPLYQGIRFNVSYRIFSGLNCVKQQVFDALTGYKT